jgi:hypothetical protein
MHMSTPRFKLAQSGLGAPQSQHAVLPGTACSVSRMLPTLPGRGAAAAGAAAAAAGAPPWAEPPPPSWPAAAASTPEVPGVGALAGGGRAGEACSLMVWSEWAEGSPSVRRPESETAPLPRGASARLSALISEEMLRSGRGGG